MNDAETVQLELHSDIVCPWSQCVYFRLQVFYNTAYPIMPMDCNAPIALSTTETKHNLWDDALES